MIPGMRQVQPVTATLIPPMAWIAYQTTAVRSVRRHDALHALVPVTSIAALLTGPEFLNIFIPGVFVAYGLAIMIHSFKGPDAQPHASLESGDLPARIYLAIGAALIASAFSDVLIVAARAFGAGYLQPWIISLFSVGNLLLIGALSLSGHWHAAAAEEYEDTSAADDAPDGEAWDKVERYMRERRPFLDPDLTLARLARKTGIPAKTLSITINRATKGNVSRYVNDARIDAAKAALLEGETVTSAMLSCGFNTKSNVNREFLRVTGTSPSAWRAGTRG